MRLKSYIPIQTDSIEFAPRTNYSNTVILIRLNPPEITRIFTGTEPFHVTRILSVFVCASGPPPAFPLLHISILYRYASHHRAQTHDPVCDRSLLPSSTASVAQRLMTMAGKGRMFMDIVHRSRKRLQLFWSLHGV